MLSIAAALLLLVSVAFAFLALGLRIRNDRRDQARTRLQESWEPAMLDVLGGSVSPDAMLAEINPKDGALFLSYLLDYARRLRGSESKVIHRLASPYLRTIVSRGRKKRQRSAEARGRDVLFLAKLGFPKYARKVAEALDDESAVVAMIAARSLFRPGQERYFPDVLERLPRFTDWSRSFLASLLAGGGSSATPLLREMLRDTSRTPLVRAVTADALRELNDLDAVPIAGELIEKESDRELLAACLRILRHLGGNEHLPGVRKMAASRDPVVRSMAVRALGAVGTPADVTLLHEKLDDPSFWVSLEAARGLVSLGASEILERLAGTGGSAAQLAIQVLAE